VSFISTSAHQKFISQCDRYVIDTSENGQVDTKDEKMELLIEDLAKLQQLTESYQDKLLQLSLLTSEYNSLQRRIRINIRKVQIVKNNK
jgi:hypothetical protein